MIALRRATVGDDVAMARVTAEAEADLDLAGSPAAQTLPPQPGS